MRTCKEDGCTRKHISRGYCGMHYYKHKLRGEFGPKCSVKGCNYGAKAHGLCAKHLERLIKNGDPAISRYNRSHSDTCSVDGCDEPYNAHGFCSKHYQQMKPFLDNRTKKSANRLCTIVGCNKKYHADGLCRSHYNMRANMRRRAAKIGNGGQHTDREWQAKLIVFAGCCAYCGATADSRDHVVPLSRGGTDNIDNIVPACRSCNSGKRDKTPEEYGKIIKYPNAITD